MLASICGMGSVGDPATASRVPSAATPHPATPISMEPRIQYAADGASIAYWTFGKGPPLLYMAGRPWNHMDLWEVPECRDW